MSMRLETYDEETWAKGEQEGILEVTLITSNSRITIVENAGYIHIVSEDGCLG
jgi:hypothetical protein